MRLNHPVTQRDIDYPASANILSTTDPRGKITYASPDFLSLCGFTIEELKGQPHNIVRHPDMPPAAFEMLWNSLKKGKNWMGIVKNRAKNGDHYWVHAYATPIQHNGQTQEIQSVRVKPEREWVARADELYRRLREGKVPGWLKRTPMSRFRQALLALVAAGCVGISCAVWLPETAWWLSSLAWLAGAGIAVWRLYGIKAALDQFWQEHPDPVARYVYTGRHDEVGALQLIMLAREAECGAVIGRVDNYTSRAAELANSVHAHSESSLHSVHDLSHRTDQVAAAVEELAVSAEQVAQSARSTADLAEGASREAQTGLGEVLQNRQAIESLGQQVERAAEAMDLLDNQAASISRIVDVIREIAEQTNLLALNAAIEAARAGEQGRGFAVVADEVRALAGRTHESTSEIIDTVNSLQSHAHATSAAMHSAQGQVNQSVECAQRTGDAMERISGALRDIRDQAASMATAVEQQSAAAAEISSNTQGIRDATIALGEDAKDSRGDCDEVAKLLGEFRKLTGQFWKRHAAG